MKISIIQTHLIWENPAANLSHLDELISAIEETELIVLPEMFSTGFTMNPAAVAEEMSGSTVMWMQSIAKSKQCAVSGSVVIAVDNHFFNRFIFVFPDGEVATYDKRHLFTLAREDKFYKAGKEKMIINYNGWKICPQICYDLRFPVFSRNVEDYDLLIYVANWPKPRISAWNALLKARAIENMCYVIGVNRIGADLNEHRYPGDSQVIDFMGEYITEPTDGPRTITVQLSRQPMIDARTKFGFLNDRDGFTVK